MATLNLSLKRALLALFFVFVAQDVAAYKPARTASKAKKSTAKANNDTATAGAEAIPIERDFDTIRGFQSYDPATDKWSTIEDFDTVDILEDTTAQRADRYIYHSFWAYDAVTRRWHKVDIRDYGYKLGQLAATEVTQAATSEEKPEEPSGFWKHWALGLRAGSGSTFYDNRIGHLKITEVNGRFFLQTAQQEKEQKSNEIHWFGKGYGLTGDPLDGNTGALEVNQATSRQVNEVKSGKKIVFKGQGWNIPITLFTHYTLFKRFRLGAGFALEINHLKELAPKEEATNLRVFKVQLGHEWFYNMAWFGLLGFKVIHEPHQDILVDLQVGRNYNLGADLHILSERENYIYDGWLFGAGVAYERKLNNYFRFVTRLSGDWKTHDDTPPDVQGTDAFITLNQIAVHLELGIHVTFGKDTAKDANAAERAADEQNKLKEAGRALRKAKDQRDRLGSKLRWNLPSRNPCALGSPSRRLRAGASMGSQAARASPANYPQKKRPQAG